MKLLTTKEFKNHLRLCITNSKKIEVFSSFIKLDALKEVTKNINKEISLNLIARWRPDDLISKASDLEVYEYCRSKNWRFGIDTTLHQKLYVFDRKNILLGSNNLTLSGLGLTPFHNTEAGTSIIEPNIEDFHKIDRVYDSVTWIDDLIYEKIIEAIKNIDSVKKKEWPINLRKIFYKPVKGLWSYEFPDILPDDDKNTSSKKEFYDSRVYQWLIFILEKNKDYPYTNFGWLTSEIHKILIDDPLPKRADVKKLTEILFAWIKKFSKDIVIKKYTHTEKISLK